MAWLIHMPTDAPNSISPEPSPAVALAIRFSEARHGVRPREITPTQLKKAQAILAALDGDSELAAKAIDLAVSEARRDPRGYPSHLGGVLEAGYPERVRAIHDDDARRRQAPRSCRTRRSIPVVFARSTRSSEMTARDGEHIYHAYSTFQRGLDPILYLGDGGCARNATGTRVEDGLFRMMTFPATILPRTSWRR